MVVQLIETAPLNRQAATTKRIISRTATADATATEGASGGALQKGGRSVTNVPKISSFFMDCPEMHAHSVFVSLRQPTAERHTRELTSTDPRFPPASESIEIYKALYAHASARTWRDLLMRPKLHTHIDTRRPRHSHPARAPLSHLRVGISSNSHSHTYGSPPSITTSVRHHVRHMTAFRAVMVVCSPAVMGRDGAWADHLGPGTHI